MKHDLETRRQQHLDRKTQSLELINGVEVMCAGQHLINFSSNDYLGLSQHPELKKSAIAFVEKYGVGSTASRLTTGNFAYTEALENKIAFAVGSETALLFNSGYQANVAVLSTLLNEKSVVFADKHNHSSLIQGVLQAGATQQRYKHNDLDHLELLLKKCVDAPHKLIVTESLFSMDGDVSDIDRLIHLSKTYGAQLFVDEAHAFGVRGEQGMGLCAHKRGIDVIMGTFSKGAGSYGAYVACSHEMRDYLINFCGGLIYTTALPPAVLGAIDAALTLIPQLESERQVLQNHVNHLLRALCEAKFDTGTSSSHVIPIRVGSASEAVSWQRYLGAKGILAVAIRPPSVLPNHSCLRLSLTSQHTPEQIQLLLNALMELKKS